VYAGGSCLRTAYDNLYAVKLDKDLNVAGSFYPATESATMTSINGLSWYNGILWAGAVLSGLTSITIGGVTYTPGSSQEGLIVGFNSSFAPVIMRSDYSSSNVLPYGIAAGGGRLSVAGSVIGANTVYLGDSVTISGTHSGTNIFAAMYTLP
jgi:hypothetical protein